MTRYLLFALGLTIFFLLLFGLVEALDIQFLKDPSYLQETSGGIAALLSVLLLASDILFPVPGSVIMIGNGALFGLWLGTLLSVIGGVISSCIGYIIGKYTEGMAKKIIGQDGFSKANQSFEKWDYLLLIISRPVPLVSETCSILAGVAKIPFHKMVLYSILGYIPGGLIYAWTGVTATDTGLGAYSFLLVIGVAGVFWLIGNKIKPLIENKA